jgi:HD-GYP domain-containing protein (c-di-GMP phosphodiesterase class II)
VTQAAGRPENIERLDRIWRAVTQARRFGAEMREEIASLAEDTLAISGRPGARCAGAISLFAAARAEDYMLTHAHNAAVLAGALARAIGCGEAFQMDIAVAALLMDVGKTATPREILNKPGRLTDLELEMVRRHPVDGARLLLACGAPPLTVAVAFEHHIRHDGGGYPDSEITWKPVLASAICQIADCFDAVRTHSPYREGKDLARVASILRVESGRRFDPGMLKTFLVRVAPAIVATPAPASLAAAAR